MDIKGQKLAVRRHKGSHGWRIPDKDRDFFIGGCQHAILQDVVFVHRARPMSCERGYESTGEAVGLFMEVNKPTVTMPTEAKRTVMVVYDARRRLFHNASDVGEVIDSADFLILNPKGTAVAGWKQ